MKSTGLPSIQALRLPSFSIRRIVSLGVSAALIVFQIRESKIGLRRALERAPSLGAPSQHLFDLARQGEILVRDALSIMRDETDLEPGVGSGDIGMMPRCFRQMSNRVYSHQRALPTVRPIFSPNPTAFQTPVRQLSRQPLHYLRFGINTYRFSLGHDQIGRA